jgi:formylglycine-generating enzyme required for sulfatase activity
VSNWGAEDMVGNVGEWVGDWADRSTGPGTDWTTSTGIAGGDISFFGGDGAAASSNIPGALVRGGEWSFGTFSAVFAVDASWQPSTPQPFIGFRCAR